MIALKRFLKFQKRIKPFLGGLLSAALVFQSVGLPGMARAEGPIALGSSLDSRNGLELLDYYPPSDLARVTDSFLAVPKSDDLVILIQDLHAHYGVQKTISGLLSHYAEQGIAKDSVAVEGAEGPVDTSLLSLFPDAGVRARVADRLLREGLISGMEATAVTSGRSDYLWGVDDQEIYELHKKLFKESLAQRNKLSRHLNTIGMELSLLKKSVYSKPMMALSEQTQGYERGTLSLSGYLRSLEKLASEQKIPFPLELGKMEEVLSLEKPWEDPSLLERETKRLLVRLAPSLTKEETARLTRYAGFDGKLYYQHLFTLVKRHNAHDLCPEDLYRYFRYNQALDSVDTHVLQRELESLAHRLLEKMASQETQKAFVLVEEDLSLMSGLLQQKLTRLDLQSVLPRVEPMIERFSHILQRHSGEEPFDKENFQELVAESLDFYALALLRDKALAEKTLEKLASQETSGDRRTIVLVTGGFHTAGITNVLKEKGVSYVVVSPNVQEYTEEDQERYIRRLMASEPEADPSTHALAIGFALWRWFGSGSPLEKHLGSAVTSLLKERQKDTIFQAGRFSRTNLPPEDLERVLPGLISEVNDELARQYAGSPYSVKLLVPEEKRQASPQVLTVQVVKKGAPARPWLISIPVSEIVSGSSEEKEVEKEDVPPKRHSFWNRVGWIRPLVTGVVFLVGILSTQIASAKDVRALGSMKGAERMLWNLNQTKKEFFQKDSHSFQEVKASKPSGVETTLKTLPSAKPIAPDPVVTSVPLEDVPQVQGFSTTHFEQPSDLGPEPEPSLQSVSITIPTNSGHSVKNAVPEKPLSLEKKPTPSSASPAASVQNPEKTPSQPAVERSWKRPAVVQPFLGMALLALEGLGVLWLGATLWSLVKSRPKKTSTVQITKVVVRPQGTMEEPASGLRVRSARLTVVPKTQRRIVTPLRLLDVMVLAGSLLSQGFSGDGLTGWGIFGAVGAMFAFRCGVILISLANEWGHLLGAVGRPDVFTPLNRSANIPWSHWFFGWLVPILGSPRSMPRVEIPVGTGPRDAFIRFFGFFFSASILVAALAYVPALRETPFLIGAGLALLGGLVTDALPALFPDWAKDRMPAIVPGVYYCGIVLLLGDFGPMERGTARILVRAFGPLVYVLSPLLHPEACWILQEVGFVTRERGEQGGGVAFSVKTWRGDSKLEMTKSPTPKGLDLPKVIDQNIFWKSVIGRFLLRRAERIVQVLLHYRVGTRGAGTRELHPHRLNPDGTAIGHNGDNDAFLFWGGYLPYHQLRELLDIAFFTNDPTSGDSPPIAGEFDLINAQGRDFHPPSVIETLGKTKSDWTAAVRWACVETVPRSFEEFKDLALTREQLKMLAAVFGSVQEVWLGEQGLAASHPLTADQRASLAKRVVAALRTDGRFTNLGSQYGERAEAMVQEAVQAYYDYDMTRAMEIFMSRVSGTYGLGVITAQRQGRGYVGCLGQPVSLGFTDDGKKVMAVSDPSSLKISKKGEKFYFRYRLDLQDGEFAELVSEPDRRIALRIYSKSLGRWLTSDDLKASGRLVDTWDNRYIDPLPERVENPVQNKDIPDSAPVMEAVSKSMQDPESFNRQTAANFYQAFRRSAPNGKTVNLLVVGKKDSRESGENFVGTLRGLFPDPSFRTACLSANLVVKELTRALNDLVETARLLGEESAEFQNLLLNFTLTINVQGQTLVLDKNTVVLGITQSGETSSTLSVIKAWEQLFPSQTFAMTGELSSEVAKPLGQSLRKEAPFTGRIFTTLTGRRPSETHTVTILAQRRLLKELALYLGECLRRDEPQGTPLGLILELEDFAELHRTNAGATRDVAEITGQTVSSFDKNSAHQGLRKLGNRWSLHYLDDYRSTILAILVYAALHGTTGLPTSGVGIVDGIFYFLIFRTLIVWSLRLLTGRPILARQGGRPMRIGASAYTHDTLEMFMRRALFSNMAFGITGGNVESDDGEDEFLDQFGAELGRQGLVLLLTPDSRLPTQRLSVNAVNMTGSQSRIVESAFNRAEVVLLGKGPAGDRNTAEFHIQLPSHEAPLSSRVRQFAVFLSAKHGIVLNQEQLLILEGFLGQHLIPIPDQATLSRKHKQVKDLAEEVAALLGLDYAQRSQFTQAFSKKRQLLLTGVTASTVARQKKVQELHELTDEVEVHLAAGFMLGSVMSLRLSTIQIRFFRGILNVLYKTLHWLVPRRLKRLVSLIFLVYPTDRSQSNLARQTTPSPVSPAAIFPLLNRFFPWPAAQGQGVAIDPSNETLPFDVLGENASEKTASEPQFQPHPQGPGPLVFDIPETSPNGTPVIILEKPELAGLGGDFSIPLSHTLTLHDPDAQIHFTYIGEKHKAETSYPLAQIPVGSPTVLNFSVDSGMTTADIDRIEISVTHASGQLSVMGGHSRAGSPNGSARPFRRVVYLMRSATVWLFSAGWVFWGGFLGAGLLVFWGVNLDIDWGSWFDAAPTPSLPPGWDDIGNIPETLNLGQSGPVAIPAASKLLNKIRGNKSVDTRSVFQSVLPLRQA